MNGRLILTSAFVASVALASVATGQQSTADRMRPLISPSLVGRDVYGSFCAPCHGVDGTGHGPVASALKTAPANLTLIRLKNGGTFPRALVEAFVTSGNATIAAHGTSDMPVWGPTFKSLEPSDALVKVRIANVIEYLESLQIGESGQVQR